LRNLARIAWTTAKQFTNDDGWWIASHISLTLLMSLFPFLIFVAALAGFLGREDLARAATGVVFAEWPPVVARPIAEQVSNVLTQRHGGLLTLGAVVACYFASSAIEALREGLNRAYGVVENRPWWLLRLCSLGLVVVSSLALLALALLIVLGPLILDAVERFAPSLAPHQFLLIMTFARIGTAALILAASLFLAHLVLPARRLRLLDLVPGVALTFVCSIALGEAFGEYLDHEGYVSMYSDLASVMIALVYLYWVALLFVVGGELNATIVRAREEARPESAIGRNPSGL
jgi:membrane protein